MCGITGQASKEKQIERGLIVSLSRALAHRGPDDEGTWFSEDYSVGMGQLRLSILDLSSLGHQPMLSPDGRFVMVYNGEIYNFRELRQELRDAGESFVSNTDTEVLLRLWSLQGPMCLSRLRGMYAFAIWDNRERCLWLVRDPLGIKPLYYALESNTITFASEIKALKSVGMAGKINPRGVGAFLRWGSIPAPLSLYRGISAVPAASFLRWQQINGRLEVKMYWNYQKAWSSSQKLVEDITTHDEALEWVRHVLIKSVQDHLVSDVPVGAFLSGGIDSTAVVSLMRQAGQQEIETFSIGFDDSALNESHYANLAAQRYSTRHHEWRVSQADFSRFHGKFLATMDQPTIDGFNIFLVSKLAHEHGIKVVTSGIGGDELFRGYPLQFRRLPALCKVLGWIPGLLRHYGATFFALPWSMQKWGHRSGRMADLLQTEPNLKDLYLWTREVFRADDVRHLFTDVDFAEEAACVDMTEFLPKMLLDPSSTLASVSTLETSRYLGSQLLADSDNFSMAHSLELRVPLVDRVLLEQIIALQDTYFTDAKNTPKALLVTAVGDIPDAIVFRKKQGFTLPFASWLKDDVWSPTSDLLDPVVCQKLMAHKSHWSRRWALEVMDTFLRE